ncbi:uncharacterized protein LOC132808037 isoform X2 [Hemiscyllium ocellatum]|uniref:uncharacterized protein LOC132808037 isoform X2 n=1 Tax=Hemiscyllium ocellatum TaxID=170820 RepID=UPI0029676490|nr:uncharacterized protein LOC132808037 isoform X2 [Hemiscyllium ocellatum]
MDQYSLSNQIEDADLKAQGPFEASEHLQASVQSIDLYEEIFNCQQNQPFTEEIGDDSMTRILISHDDDDDYYDQNVSELQVNTSETEDQFETGIQIAITEEGAVKEKDIPLKDPFTGMEKGTLEQTLGESRFERK